MPTPWPTVTFTFLRPTPTFTPISPVLTPFPTATNFLKCRGTNLMLQGEVFREISFNKFDLFHQFVLEGYEHKGADGRKAAREALRILGEKGFRVVRVNVSPFYPKWFNDVFFDKDPQRQKEKRQHFFTRFDEMLDTCDQHGIQIVATLLWNWENLADLGHHSLREGLRNPLSPGRQKIEEYIRAIVGRYRDRPTIAMWEICNEWNLGADLQAPNGIIFGHPGGDDLHPGPVIRDERNNFTSEELAAFFKDVAELIRSIDPNHLITTGASAPRPSAMHLLRAARSGLPPDWTLDSEEELIEYIRMIHPDPIDVISIHYYDEAMTCLGRPNGSPGNIQFFKAAADRIGKPLFIGEIGLYNELKRYDRPQAMEIVQRTLPVIVNSKIPLTLYWTFNDDRTWARERMLYSLRYGKTDEVLRLIEKANAEIKMSQ